MAIANNPGEKGGLKRRIHAGVVVQSVAIRRSCALCFESKSKIIFIAFAKTMGEKQNPKENCFSKLTRTNKTQLHNKLFIVSKE